MSQATRPRNLRVVAAVVAATIAGACAPAPGTTGAPGAAVGPPVDPPTRAIVFPLARSVKYSDTFGAARSGGRSHEGQDLMAPKGTLAVAAASGTVTSVRYSSDGLSGNMLRITDAEGWVYVYIHLNNDTPGTDDGSNVFDRAFADGMRVGQHVIAGEPIGFVGDSGNAEDTGAHLHFEIRSPDGAAVNAYSSLRAAPVSVLSPQQIDAAAPFGAVDTVVAEGPGAVRATGWALDRAVDNVVPVSIYVDGTPRATTTLGTSRPDIAAAFTLPGSTQPYGTSHGFSVAAGGVSAGQHDVCVVFHNAGAGGGSARVGCRAITVS